MHNLTKKDLIAFEDKIIALYGAGKIKAPVHLSGGNEYQLIDIFKNINSTDWVFSTWRSHYHALLHGIPEDWLYKEILTGHSITIQCPKHRFYSSAIVGSIAPVAVGTAMAMKYKKLPDKVWCFIGDMGSQMGTFYEALKYAHGHDLPITFVIEDNGLCVNTATQKVWGRSDLQSSLEISKNIIHYSYTRKYPHMGIGKFINF